MPTLPRHAYHLADAQNWESIRRDGLLTTDSLVKRGAFGAEVERGAGAHRPEIMILPDGAVIRDQKPMPPAKLAPRLDDGLSPEDWYALLNAAVFFWLDPERLERHLAAQRRPMMLLTFDAPRLVQDHAAQAFVTPFNTGAAYRKPARRGLRTFVPVERWRTEGWASENPTRKPAHAPAELVIRADLPDALDHLLEARPLPFSA